MVNFSIEAVKLDPVILNLSPDIIRSILLELEIDTNPFKALILSKPQAYDAFLTLKE